MLLESSRQRPLPFSRLETSCALLAGLCACSGEGSLQRPSPRGLAPPAGAQGASSTTGMPPAAGGAGSNADEPATGATTSAQEFELAWQDDFDAFDATRWQLMTHSWDSNLALFSTENVQLEAGVAALRLTRAPDDALKPFRGVEMRSREALTYGKVEARARFARGSGVVSALVLIYTPWPADDWNELDIEYLGRHSDRIQFNSMVYLGPPTSPPVIQSVTPTMYPQLAALDFDPAADFHVYAVEWTPTQARFRVDAEVVHTWDTEISRLKLPMNILLTIWASSAADWAGPIDSASAPVAAEYDWLKVYRYTGSAP